MQPVSKSHKLLSQREKINTVESVKLKTSDLMPNFYFFFSTLQNTHFAVQIFYFLESKIRPIFSITLLDRKFKFRRKILLKENQITSPSSTSRNNFNSALWTLFDTSLNVPTYIEERQLSKELDPSQTRKR